MVGRTCRLEPLTVHRAADLFAAYASALDDRDWTYLPHERPADADGFRELIAAQALSVDPLHHAIVETARGRALGTAALMRIDPANGVIEIGHINYAPALQRTAAGTEAIYLLMRRVFDELGYRRLEWKCDSLNAPSRRAAVRYGFTYEGTFQQAVVTKGRNRDTAWYALLDRDWPHVRAAMKAWLEVSNFDPHGAQRKPLAAGADGALKDADA